MLEIVSRYSTKFTVHQFLVALYAPVNREAETNTIQGLNGSGIKRPKLVFRLRSRDAIYLDETDVIYYARTCVGRRYMLRKDGRVAYLELQWSAQEIPFPAQLVTAAPPQTEDKPRITVEQLFPINGRAFVLGFPYYGCMGEVRYWIVTSARRRWLFQPLAPVIFR